MSEPLPSRFAITSRLVVTPAGVEPATIVVDAGKIIEVSSAGRALTGLEVFDFGDAVVAPGVVDAHVHINEPGRTDWEGFATATAAAAAGGVTTLIDMPLNSSPVVIDVAALEAKRTTATGKLYVDVALYGGVVKGSAAAAGDLTAAGVAGVKAFLCDSGLAEFPAATEADLRELAPVLAAQGVPLLVHAELPLAASPPPRDQRSYTDYLASRPPAWEADAIRMLIDVCRDTNCRVHVVHLANSEALCLIDAAKAQGLPITVETCPHYLHFAAEEIPDGDTRYKCAPPIREQAHREALWQGLREGRIDTVGSDHSPCPPELKQLEMGDFAQAWGGVAGLELTLPVVWTGARERGIEIAEVFRWLSVRPAEIFGLCHRKGRLDPGYDADIVVFDPEASWVVDAQQLRHRHKVTPYDRAPLTGRVLQTFLAGQCVYADGRLIGTPQGSLLTPRFTLAGEM